MAKLGVHAEGVSNVETGVADAEDEADDVGLHVKLTRLVAVRQRIAEQPPGGVAGDNDD